MPPVQAPPGAGRDGFQPYPYLGFVMPATGENTKLFLYLLNNH